MLFFDGAFAAVVYMANALDSWFDTLWYVWGCILGGLVAWVGFLIARWICHNGIGGSGRRFKR